MLGVFGTTYENLHLEIASKVVQFFSSVVMRNEILSAVFAHEKYLSIFDLKTFEWSNHMELDDKIVSLF